jgi:hypothetical protein
MSIQNEGLLDELTARAWALGYRLVKREHDYLLWGVHQRKPMEVTHSAPTLDASGDIADMLDAIAGLPRYCLELSGNSRVQVVAQANGRRIVRDTATGEFFKLLAGEHVGAPRITVHAKYPPPVGNWMPAAPTARPGPPATPAGVHDARPVNCGD